jgi:Domain of unknown function (DUF4252)
VKRNLIRMALAVVLSLPAWAEADIKMPVNLDKLAERASESVDVTLDASTLRLASGFLSKENADEVEVKDLVGKLKGVYVRSFQFDKPGQYSLSDVEAIRLQLRAPEWSRIVGVKSIKGENTEVYLQKTGDQISGLVVLSAEPKELTIVHIDGPINPEQLSRLGGHMGIPDFGAQKKKLKQNGAKDE